MHRRKTACSTIVTIFLFLSFSGCAIGPDYRRPSIDAPSSWRLTEPEAKDLADTTWWKQFDDPVLNELITSALKENKDLRMAAARVEEFIGRYGITRSALFPQVSVSGIGQRKGGTDYTNPPWSSAADNPYNNFQAFSSASWEIDMWGRIRRATEASRADLLGTEEGRRGVILTVVTAVAIAYTDLRHLDKQLEIAQRTAKSRKDSFNLFSLRFERGLISELELRQAESEYKSALATIPLLEKLIGQQEDGLNVLLGRNPGPIPRGRHLDTLVLPEVPAGLPSQLLGRRPDIRQAEQNLIAANARIGVAKALYFPSISLTGSYGVESKDLSNLFTGPSKMWSYGVPVTVPIFTAGGIAGQVKAAEALRDQNLIRYQQVIQQAFREVEDALIDQRKSREQLAMLKQQLEALRSYSSLATLRYENGYTSYLEVLDAERGLFNAELAYAQTQGVLFRALVNLYKSVGGGWVAHADKITEER
ncbi:MAG: efflux transporter outer membrane subunit [Proteobacteria bacterium]|nr:efflux transporter outer membrane subunit [Pseudomonadota bacterium]